MLWAWMAIQLGLGSAAALTVGTGRARKALGAMLLAVVVVLPAFAPLDPPQTVVQCFLAIVTFLKVTQIAAAGGQWGAGRRLWHLFGVVDTRDARRVSRQLDVRAMGLVLINATLAIVALAALGRLSDLEGISRNVIWVLATATFVYSAFDVFSGLVHVVYRALGFEVRALQCHPVLARNLAEFWGRRWNRVVGGWLREFVFEPLARKRRPRLGVAASFGVSAFIHAWLIIALGASAAAMMAAYFLVQGAGLFVEARSGLRRAPAIVGRMWMAGMLLIPLPLFFGPWMEALNRAYFQAS